VTGDGGRGGFAQSAHDSRVYPGYML
jgi:hypothetical protein